MNASEGRPSPPPGEDPRLWFQAPPQDPYVRLQAQATGSARVFQAARDLYAAERDLHVHYTDGVRAARRATAGSRLDECPYPGLFAFGSEQSQWFFGRDTATADLLVRLDERLRTGGPVAVVAPSGAGKSSLLQAGLLPELARGALPAHGSADWPHVLLTPTARPVRNLRARLASAGRTRRDPDERLVVVVDQLEELFTLCEDEDEHRDFVDVLAGLARADPGGGRGPDALVVLGLRSDFYTPCAAHPWLRDALEHGQRLLGPLTEEELREAILYPAQAVGLDVEPGLVELLLRDLGGGGAGHGGAYEAGRLPLLAHALRTTWQQRAGHVLTVEGYRATGGIHHAVATTAEDVYAGLDPPARNAARGVFLRLVRFGDRTEDTRRGRTYAELLDAAGEHGTAATATVVERFTDRRLLTRDQDHVEITHEALLSAWPRLHEWTGTGRADHLMRQELEQAAADWDRSGRDAGMLYRGNRLDAVRTWFERPHHDPLGPVSEAFYTASLRSRRRARRLRRTVIAAVTALAVIASVAAVIAFRQTGAARAERDTAVFNQVLAEADSVRPASSSLAAQLDLVAHRMRPDDRRVATRLLVDAGGPLSAPVSVGAHDFNQVAFSPDGDTLATAGSDHTVRLWDMSDPARATQLGRPLKGHEGKVWSVAFSAEGSTLVSAGNDSTLRVWDITDRERPRALRRLVATDRSRPVTELVFAPEGDLLASTGADLKTRLWDMSDVTRPVLVEPDLPGTLWLQDVAFSRDGAVLAGVEESGLVSLWDVRDPSRARRLGKQLTGGRGGRSVSFSADGKLLAAAYQDGTVRLWDVTRPEKPRATGSPLGGHTEEIRDVAFSPRGRTLASAGFDGTVRLWNTTAPAEASSLGGPLAGQETSVDSIAFAPDGRGLVSAGGNGAWFWGLPDNVLTAHTDSVGDVAFTPDSRTLASSSADGSVRLWDVARPARPRSLLRIHGFAGGAAATVFGPRHGVAALNKGGSPAVHLWDFSVRTRPRKLTSVALPDAGGPIAFSPEAEIMVAGHFLGGDDYPLRLYDIADPRHPRPLDPLLVGHGDFPLAAAFSPDGRTLVSGGQDGTVRLWDVSDPARATALGSPLGTPPVLAVAISPNGRTVAAATGSGAILMWDVSDRIHPETTGPGSVRHLNVVNSVAFSPDGRTLASGGQDGTVRLWDVSDPARTSELGRLISLGSSVTAVTFSSDGHTLAAAATDGTVRLWNMDPEQAVRQICRSSRNTLAKGVWQQHLPGIPYADPCA